MNNYFDYLIISAFIGAGFTFGASIIVAVIVAITHRNEGKKDES